MAKKQKPPGGGEKKPPVNAATIFEKGVTRTIDLDKPDDISPEDIERLSKAFGKFFEAEVRGEELDPHIDIDEFQLSVSGKVKEAIKKYSEDADVDLSTNLQAEQNKIAMLFHPKKLVEANAPYRTLVKEGHYRFVGNDSVFERYRAYRGVIDKDAVEKLMRRVDSEVRLMDPLVREELLFNFVNSLLSSDFANSRISLATADQFNPASLETQELLRDMVLFYMDARAHARASMKGYNKANKDFDSFSIRELLEIPTTKQVEYPVRVEYAHITRAIRPKGYYLILQLLRALPAALPAKVQAAVDVALVGEKNVRTDVTTINSRLINPSKYLRQAFISLSRGHGSFEAFFTALYDFQRVLDAELNDKVTAVRYWISVYDSLGLDIANTLKSSSRRILNDTPF